MKQLYLKFIYFLCITPFLCGCSSLAIQENDRYITKYSIDLASPGTGNDTGPLHIIYNNGSEIILERHLTGKHSAYTDGKPAGVGLVQLSDDQRTMGWAEYFFNCCTSYTIPLKLIVFRNGRVVHQFAQGQMLRNWMFQDQGRKIAAEWGATHGQEWGNFILYDIQTGKILDEVDFDPAFHSLPDNAPDWAKQLGNRSHRK